MEDFLCCGGGLMSEASLVVAVVVTFHPDLSRLGAQIFALLPQVGVVVLVDNDSHTDIAQWVKQWPVERVHLIRLGQNLGIATAQNRGIEWACSTGASHVLLMDHDSIPALDMVTTLLMALACLPRAAAVGPCYSDARLRANPKSPFVRVQGWRMKCLPCVHPNGILEVDHLIASGCLIPVSVLSVVGVMRDDFFIDFVDIEWCLRARHAGYTLHGVCAAKMDHQLGDASVRLFSRDFSVHPPWRHYFLVRNAVRIYKLSWVPFSWKVASAWRLLLKCGFHVLLTPPRWLRLRQMVRGCWDGLVQPQDFNKNARIGRVD